jgi:hypothetical protein
MVDNTDIVPAVFRAVQKVYGGRVGKLRVPDHRVYECQTCKLRVFVVDGEALRQEAARHQDTNPGCFFC